MTRDDKIKSIRFAILWVVSYYILLFVTSTLVFPLMKLSIFDWINDIEDYGKMFGQLIVYMITCWISFYILWQIQCVIIKQEEILEHSHWVAGVTITGISVIFLIISATVAHIAGRIDSNYPFIYYGTLISCGTIFARMFFAYSLPDNNIHSDRHVMDKDDIKKTARVILAIIIFVVSSSVVLDLFFTNEIETYICYTTESGDCFHAEYCQYLWNSAEETNVYEAKKDGYQSCSRCSPYNERYAIIYQDRNYLVSTILGAVLTGGGVVGIIQIKKHINKDKTKGLSH